MHDRRPRHAARDGGARRGERVRSASAAATTAPGFGKRHVEDSDRQGDRRRQRYDLFQAHGETLQLNVTLQVPSAGMAIRPKLCGLAALRVCSVGNRNEAPGAGGGFVRGNAASAAKPAPPRSAEGGLVEGAQLARMQRIVALLEQLERGEADGEMLG